MCECIADMNRLMAEKELNTILEVNLFGPPKALIRSIKKDDKVRKKPSIVFASYCPFCGTKYEKTDG